MGVGFRSNSEAEIEHPNKYLRSILGDRAEISEAHPITLLNDSEPEPDIAILKTPDTLYQHRHPRPADVFWLIEIANITLAKDLGIKKDRHLLFRKLRSMSLDYFGDNTKLN